YCIPANLHPHLLPPDLTMDKLPSKYIRLVPIRVNRVILFEISCRSLNIKATVSLFRVFYNLCKHGYWFLFENKTGGRLKKCFKEVTSSLKGWKKKFFLIDRRAVTDAMPWRNFPNNYNDGDAECLAEFTVPLRPPLCHLLYVCRLTTACQHLELSSHSVHEDDNVETSTAHPFIPEWGLWDDLQELNRLRNDLQRDVQSNGGLTKQLTLLEIVHAGCSSKERELMDRLKDMEKESDDGRKTASKQVEKIKKLEEAIKPKSNWLGGLSLGKTQEQIIVVLSKTSNLEIEGSETWKDKHHELFTKQYPYIQKVVESRCLPVDTLLKISPDVPTPFDVGAGPSIKNNDGGATTQVPPEIQMAETASGAPPKTTI
nr:hypothetical protein [Tanacetum cinerariifolium]